jgi:two-component system response regulator AtoC
VRQHQRVRVGGAAGRDGENVMERAILFADGGEITPEELPDQVRRTPADPDSALSDSQRPDARSASSVERASVAPIGPLKEIIRQHTETLEKDLITRALEETGGNVTQAARKLAISRKSLQNKMKELKLREGLSDDDHEAADS